MFKLGTIAPGYSSGNPKIIFDGETNPTSKAYPYIKSYTPKSGDRVLIAKVSETYVVIGKI